jgi:hypothetical protein
LLFHNLHQQRLNWPHCETKNKEYKTERDDYKSQLKTALSLKEDKDKEIH